jgi:2-iminobutanoate/2-iminopropanoate deaminase
MSTRREFFGMAALFSVFSAKQQSIQFISSTAAPKAIGPYSQAVRAGNTIYASGQIALDPASGKLIEGDFSAQARRVLENLKAVLREAGTDFRRVVKATVYVTDVSNFQTLNTIYTEYFGDHKPARSFVGVAQLPRGAALEIDLIVAT